MKKTELDQWQLAVDVIEDETRDHLDIDAPELSPGECWTAPDGRIWRNVPIAYGKVGGRWCYWKSIKADLFKVTDVTTVLTQSLGAVIVDDIFNGWSPFFAGMLRIPYDGHVTSSLMLIKEGVLVPQSIGNGI